MPESEFQTKFANFKIKLTYPKVPNIWSSVFWKESIFINKLAWSKYACSNYLMDKKTIICSIYQGQLWIPPCCWSREPRFEYVRVYVDTQDFRLRILAYFCFSSTSEH